MQRTRQKETMSVPQAAAMVATLLEPSERSRLDAAGVGRFRALHTDSVQETIRAVRERPVSAVLVSPGRVGAEELRGVARLIRAFPGVPMVAVLSQVDPPASERLLALGACGVRRIVDLQARDGWRSLRELLANPGTPTAALILARAIPALGSPTADCRRFFEILVRRAPHVTTVRRLSADLGLQASTFMSRFFRAGLPSPKRYLAAVRLVFAARLLEAPGRSLSDVAYQLGYSSPQSFGRHIRTGLGCTAAEYRRRFGFGDAMQDFVSRLIVPYQSRFRTFNPLMQRVSDLGHVC